MRPGFDINQKLIPFSASGSTYGQAFYVGLLNTLLVASIGIVLSTFLGFFIGVSRLSSNWVLSKLAMIYVEVIRNLPLLLQLFFWYNAVLKPLPDARNSIALPGSIFLNNRGLIMPNPLFAPAFQFVVIAFFVAVVLAIGFYTWAKRQQERTGRQYPEWHDHAGLADRAAAADLFRRRQAADLRSAAAGPLQPARRHAGLPGIRRPAARPDHLYGGLHRRGGARRHPGCLAAGRRRPRMRWACAPGRR